MPFLENSREQQGTESEGELIKKKEEEARRGEQNPRIENKICCTSKNTDCKENRSAWFLENQGHLRFLTSPAITTN